jgi:hypothetical protein
MNELQTWFKLNNLVVNAEKTLAIPFHTFQNKKPVLPHVILEEREMSHTYKHTLAFPNINFLFVSIEYENC